MVKKQSKHTAGLLISPTKTGAAATVGGGMFLSAALISLFVRPIIDAQPDATLLAAALLFDLVIAVPALVYATLVRAGRLRPLFLIPIAVAGYATAAATMPDQEALFDMVRPLVGLVELAIVGWLIWRVKRGLAAHSGSGDFAGSLRESLLRMTGNRVAAGIIATEVALLYYALRWPRQSHSQAGFTVHRDAGYSAVVIGLIGLLAVETAVVHVVLLQWSATTAWILSALSVYAVIWFVGDYRALSARSIVLTKEALQLHIGLRWEATVPYRLIETVETVKEAPEVLSKSSLKIDMMGQVNVRIRLRETTEVIGMYGIRRRVDEILLQVDDAGRFLGEVKENRGAGSL